MGLRDRREAALAAGPAALDEVELPERPALVERLRHDPADELAQLGVAAGGGDRDVADVAATSKSGSSSHSARRILPGSQRTRRRKRGINSSRR